MVIQIENDVYSALKALSFSPETDLFGTSLPINTFEADVYTRDDIAAGQYARLYDDRDQLWAKYWITLAKHIHPDVIHLRAESDAAVLEGVTLSATYFNGASVTSVLDDTIVYNSGAEGIVARMTYAIDGSLVGRTLTGFCPEQTARERLVWICFVLGAHVRTAFNECITILPIDEGERLVPLGQTFMRPSISFGDIVTAIRLKYFSFTPGVPETTDKWVRDSSGNVYIQTERELKLGNPDAIAGIPDNTVTVDNVTLVNADNVNDVANAMARWYFNRSTVSVDIINNREYVPGERLMIYTGEDSIRMGWVRKMDFRFGVQARSQMELKGTEDVEAGRLVITYVADDLTLNTAVFTFPMNYEFSIQNPWFDQLFNSHRIIYRPLQEAAEGVMDAAEVDDEEQYAPALDLDTVTNVLEIISVDALTESDGVVTIG